LEQPIELCGAELQLLISVGAEKNHAYTASQQHDGGMGIKGCHVYL
jgi:hypothetical protein